LIAPAPSPRLVSKVISIEGLHKTYSPKSPVVFREANLQLAEGDFAYLVGGSGFGKSTLLRIVAGLERFDRGKIQILGTPVPPTGKTPASLRSRVRLIPQTAELLPEEHVDLVRSFAHKAEHPEAERRLWERLGLSGDRFDRKTEALSGGEAQRFEFGLALLGQPRLILADEPTGAQDRDRSDRMMEILAEHQKKGATLLVATHDLDLVRRHRRKCYVIDKGLLRLEPFGA
jgi:ABC-type lipoprotein export system ATPase subunit